MLAGLSMERCMVLSLFLLSLSAAAQAFDTYITPPSFILPKNLDEPKSLIIVGNITKTNTLVCTVENADSVQWLYYSRYDAEAEGLPDAMKQEKMITNRASGTLSRSLVTDKNAGSEKKRQLNGYYRCHAENYRAENNEHTGYSYKILSPPIRFISPEIRVSSIDLIEHKSINPGAPLRMACLNREETVLTPPDLLSWGVIKYFYWSNKASDNYNTITPNERIKIDQRTGDLFFVYVERGDSTGNEDEYQCKVIVQDKPDTQLLSRHRLDVSEVDEPTDVKLVYPISVEDSTVDCVEQYSCKLTCIFGGRNLNTRQTPAEPRWSEAAGSENFLADDIGNSVSFMAYPGASGVWTCELPNQPSLQAAEISVDVKLFPDISNGQITETFVEEGSDVKFTCNSKHAVLTKISINGESKDYTRDSEQSLSYLIRNAQRSDSGIVSCLAYNAIGTKYQAAELNVYGNPNITLMPEGGFILSSENFTNDQEFHCSAKVDPKVISADLHWRTNLTKEKLTQSHDMGIQGINTKSYNPTLNQISSTLYFDLDVITQNTLAGGVWWCVVEMKFPGRESLIVVNSKQEPFGFANKPQPVIRKAGFAEWWIIGVIVAVLFFILIVVLIVCCVKHHQGEDYYVDEKERKAGHKPEEEMGLYGFSDYKRPATGGYIPMSLSDQDPIKGSRTSMDMSDKPLDSDSEGMDEYGDIDPGRFNEDGSFIGLYGKSSAPIDV